MTVFTSFCPAVLAASLNRFLGGFFTACFPDLWLNCCFQFVFIDLFNTCGRDSWTCVVNAVLLSLLFLGGNFLV